MPTLVLPALLIMLLTAAPLSGENGQGKSPTVVPEGLSSLEPAVRHAAMERVLADRGALVRGLEDLVRRNAAGRNQLSYGRYSSAVWCLEQLGAYEARAVLVEQIDYGFPVLASSGRRAPGRPQFAALLEIGLPTIPPILDHALHFETEETQKHLAAALIDILGQDCAAALIQLRKERTPTEKRKLLDLLLSQVRTHRRDRTDLSPMQPPPLIPSMNAASTTDTLRSEPILLYKSRLDVRFSPWPPPTLREPIKQIFDDLGSDDASRRQRGVSTVTRLRITTMSALNNSIALGFFRHGEKPDYRGLLTDALWLMRQTGIPRLYWRPIGGFILDHLAFILSETDAGEDKELAAIPQVHALISFGLPTLDPVAKKVASSNDAITLQRGAIIIDEILGTRFALLYVQDRIRRETDEAKKKRLVQLEQQIDTVERHRKVKFQRSPLEVAIAEEPAVEKGK